MNVQIHGGASRHQQWMAESRIGHVSDEQAKIWLDNDVSLWAVVLKPWLLVQLAKAE